MMATGDDECEQVYIFLNNHCFLEGCGATWLKMGKDG